MPRTLDLALDLICIERGNQDKKWGANQILNPEEWMPILMEEVGEVAAEVQDYKDKYGSDAPMIAAGQRYISEVIQVAAVATAMIESYLNGGGKLPEVTSAD